MPLFLALLALLEDKQLIFDVVRAHTMGAMRVICDANWVVWWCAVEATWDQIVDQSIAFKYTLVLIFR